MSSANIEEGVPAKEIENGNSAHSGTSGVSRGRALSKVSRLYDIDGDGNLDEVEQALRDMDTEGVGHLSNAQVYSIFQQQLTMQKQLLMAKRIIIFFAVFLVLLAVANIGIAFAAASLSKDTSTQNNVLVVKETGEVVATQPYRYIYDLHMTEERRRSLAEEDPDTFFTDGLCVPYCSVGEDNSTALMIHQQCTLGNPVTVRLSYKPPKTISAVSLTSYVVCNEGTTETHKGTTESYEYEGEGEWRDGVPKIILKFNITEESSNNIAGGAVRRRRRLNSDDPPTYTFENGGSWDSPWHFTVSTGIPIPTTAASVTTTAAP